MIDLRLRNKNDQGVMCGLYDLQSEEDGRSIQVKIPKFDLIPRTTQL